MILRDQSAAAHSAQPTGARAAIAHVMDAAGIKQVRQLATADSLAAPLTTAQADALRANPDVAMVVPDAPVNLTPPPASPAPPSTGAAGVCPADQAKPLLEPEGLDLTGTTKAQATATGKGVKVGIVGVVADPANPDLIRADGSPVVAEVHNFGATPAEAVIETMITDGGLGTAPDTATTQAERTAVRRAATRPRRAANWLGERLLRSWTTSPPVRT